MIKRTQDSLARAFKPEGECAAMSAIVSAASLAMVVAFVLGEAFFLRLFIHTSRDESGARCFSLATIGIQLFCQVAILRQWSGCRGLRFHWTLQRFQLSRRGEWLFDVAWADVRECRPSGSSNVLLVADRFYTFPAPNGLAIRAALDHYLGDRVAEGVTGRRLNGKRDSLHFRMAHLVLMGFSAVSFMPILSGDVLPRWEFGKLAKPVDAHVDYAYRSRRTNIINYSFSVRGQKFRGEDSRDGQELSMGDSVTAYYNPADPRDNRLSIVTAREFGFKVGEGAVLAIIVVGGIGFTLVQIRKLNRTESEGQS